MILITARQHSIIDLLTCRRPGEPLIKLYTGHEVNSPDAGNIIAVGFNKEKRAAIIKGEVWVRTIELIL